MLTAIGTATIATSSSDIEATFQSAAANIATIPASNQFTYNGKILHQGDGKSVLFIPASVVANVTIRAGYAYVVVAQGSKANLSNAPGYSAFPNPIIVGDGFSFTGDASVVANGGGSSNITDTHQLHVYRSTAIIHTAGTGTLNGGLYSPSLLTRGLT